MPNLQPARTSTGFFSKKIPTVVGLTILIASLAAGVFFLGDGLGVFAPRATPQTTPKNIKITNVTDTSFTVSFLTDEVTTGFLKYGTKENQLTTQVSDDRDQLTGNVGTYSTHHITVRGMQPQTTYYFILGTASQNNFDNEGQPFTVTTTPKLSNLSLAQTIYGTVLTPASSPADGSIVYVNIQGADELSTLVRSSGTWAIPLSQARTADGTSQPNITSETPMELFVQGKSESETVEFSTTVGQPQLPVETLTLGQSPKGGTTSPTPIASSDTDLSPSFTSTPSASISPSPTAAATSSATPAATPRPTATPTATPNVVQPSTSSAQPVSGSLENTIVMGILGLTFFSFGGFLYLSLKKGEVHAS